MRPAGVRRPEKAAYVVKVTLLGVRPPVWRRLLVPAHIHLGDLHGILQAAMGWKDCHLHVFSVAKGTFGAFAPDGDDAPGTDWDNECRVMLRDLGPGAEFLYEYDIGDDWKHRVRIESLAPGTSLSAPVCIGGSRACPPDNCGGRRGYAELLLALADARRKRHAEARDWLGLDFDPDAFDAERVTSELRRRWLNAPRRRR